MKYCYHSFIIPVSLLCIAFAACKEDKAKIKFEYGTFPDTVIALAGINTEYNDYNATIEETYNLNSSLPIVFSSDRNNYGVSFDLVYGFISYSFNQMTGDFTLSAESTEDPFLKALVAKMNTTGNDYGPNRIYCSEDGYEYTFVASDISGSALDIRYSRYLPYIASVPVIPAPVEATVFNTASNDAYISFNKGFDTAYFCSDRNGDFDIYYIVRGAGLSFNEWLLTSQAPESSIDSINTTANEKCPFISGRVMVFASDMSGGYGGWDLYYSVFKKGKWSSPVNMGNKINTEYNEYRPVICSNNSFTNRFLIFSSDRPGGKGGYDLYFSSFNIK
jgi:hypothetical protein